VLTGVAVIVALLFFSPLGISVLILLSKHRAKRVEGFLKAVFLGVSTIGGFAGCGAIGVLAKGCGDSIHGLPEATGEVEFGLALLGIFLVAVFVCGVLFELAGAERYGGSEHLKSIRATAY